MVYILLPVTDNENVCLKLIILKEAWQIRQNAVSRYNKLIINRKIIEEHKPKRETRTKEQVETKNKKERKEVEEKKIVQGACTPLATVEKSDQYGNQNIRQKLNDFN